MNSIILPWIYAWLLNNSLLLISLGGISFGVYLYYSAFLEVKHTDSVDLMERYLNRQMYKRYSPRRE